MSLSLSLSYQWVLSPSPTHSKKSCLSLTHISMSHVSLSLTYLWVMSLSHTHINESCLFLTHIYKWVMSLSLTLISRSHVSLFLREWRFHVCKSHVTHMNEWYCTNHKLDVWKSSRMHESRHSYILFMSHMWMSHAIRMEKSMLHRAHACMSHVTHLNWIMSHV